MPCQRPWTFVYAPPAGTVLAAGMQNLTATFTPTDYCRLHHHFTNVSLTVNRSCQRSAGYRQRPSPSAPHSARRSSMLPPTSLELSCTRRARGRPWEPARRIHRNIHAGRRDRLQHRIRQCIATINKALPTISWASPVAITYGTALSSTDSMPLAKSPGLSST